MNLAPKKIQRAVMTKLPNLRFAGYVSRDSLRDAYGGCDLFLFPSKEETEGIVVLEALAMKIPVLVRDIPVYEDWIEADREAYKAGDITEFERKTREILRGVLPNLAENGYRVVEQRTIEQVGEKLEVIYRHCLDSVPGAFSVVKGVKVCLERFRSETMQTILGLMIGSLYAIMVGPTTLEVPREALGSGNFSVAAFSAGIVIIVIMQIAGKKKDQ